MSVATLRVDAARPATGGRAWDLAIAGLIALAGVGFNLARLQLRLDEGPLSASLVAFAAFGAGALALAFSRGLHRPDLGLTAPLPGPALVGGGLAAASLLGAAFLTAPVLHIPALPQVARGILLFGFFTAPAEELMFRGVMFRLVERHAGASAAIITTSAAFAVAHVPVYGWLSLPLSLVAGFLLGWLRWWSRSLIPAVAVHALADLGLLWL